MTIKQQGGIFGRNPTFNDLTVEGTLTSSGTFAPSGQVTVSEDGDAALVVNRNTDNGTVVQVKQANAEVGYIATQGGDLVVGTGDTSLRFIDSLDCYFPVSTSSGTTRDNAIDIGYTEARYKDLYLGGGIYIQASSATPVAANYLDDYEEGTWTPVVADASSGGNTSASVFTGDYTKVGNLVFVNCSLVDIDTTGLTAGNDLYIQGLPFTPKSGTLFAGSVFGRVTISGKWCTAAISSSPAIRLEDNPGTTSNPSRVQVSAIVDDGGDLRISITYIEA
jgi:hypothetical protein